MAESPATYQGHKGRERSVEAIGDFCRSLTERLKMHLSVDCEESQDGVRVNITGPDRSYLLSNSAALLNSIEHLVNKVFYGGKAEGPVIVLDSDKYRQHREAELVLLAQMAAQKVISLRKPLTLQPMIPRERRIVHLALSGIEEVRTQSEGEGDNRSITIYPL